MSNDATKKEIDFKLDLFLKYVDNKKAPPQSLLEFVADGIREYRKDMQPWQIKTGRKRRGSAVSEAFASLQAYCMRQCGFNYHQIAGLLSDSLGGDSDSSVKRAISDGKAIAEEVGAGLVNYQLAIERLLLNTNLTTEEFKKVNAELKRVTQLILED